MRSRAGRQHRRCGCSGVVVGRGLASEVVAAWVAASCSAQGVPVKIADAGAIRDVAVLLTGRDRIGPGAPQGVKGRSGLGRARDARSARPASD